MNKQQKIILKYRDDDKELLEVLDFFKENDLNLSGFIRGILRKQGLKYKAIYKKDLDIG